MAQKRMFSLNVVDTDKFLEMPVSSRLLYYELGMRADDDGFVDNWKKILMFTGLKEDDMKVLITKQFIIPFESGVIVIRHWRMNNYLQNDRTKPTIYQEELRKLGLDNNNVYTMDTKCIHSIDKNSIDKNSIKKENIKEKNISYFLSILSANDYKYIIEDSPLFNKIKDWLNYKEERKEIYKQTGLQSLLKQIENKIDEYGEEQIINLIDECMASNYKGIIFDRLKNKTTGSKKVGVVPEWLGKDIKKGDFSEETEKLCREVFGNNKE